MNHLTSSYEIIMQSVSGMQLGCTVANSSHEAQDELIQLLGADSLQLAQIVLKCSYTSSIQLVREC